MNLIWVRVTGFCCFVRERIHYWIYKLLINANLNLTEMCLKVIDIIGKIPTPIVNALEIVWQCVRFAMKVACYSSLFAVFLIIEIIESLFE